MQQSCSHPVRNDLNMQRTLTTGRRELSVPARAVLFKCFPPRPQSRIPASHYLRKPCYTLAGLRRDWNLNNLHSNKLGQIVAVTWIHCSSNLDTLVAVTWIHCSSNLDTPDWADCRHAVSTWRLVWFSVALCPQRRVGLLGTGTEWEGGERVKGSKDATQTQQQRPDWVAAYDNSHLACE